MNASEAPSTGAISAIERRSEERTTAVYRPVLIEVDEFSGFCLVKNLSPGGLMGVVYAQFAVEQPIIVHFHPEHLTSGVIVWSQDDVIGVRFDRPLDVDAVLRDVSRRRIGALVNRAPRLPIECDGEVELDGRPVPVTVRDISQRGLKAVVPFVRPGDEVVVRLEGMEPHKAEVRWTQGGVAGMNFIRPVGFEDLARWVVACHSSGADPT